MSYSGSTHGIIVVLGLLAERCINEEDDVTGNNMIHNARPSFVDLVDSFSGDTQAF